MNLETGELTASPGSTYSTDGDPWGMAIDSSGTFLYTANNTGGDINAFAIVSESGALAPLASSPILVQGGISQPSNIAVDPAGRFAYLSDNALTTVQGMYLNPSTGELAPTSPDTFAIAAPSDWVEIDPTGQFVYVSNLTDVHQLKIDSDGSLSGLVTYPVGTTISATVIDPLGQFFYLTDSLGGDLKSFKIDPSTGDLSEIAGSPALTGDSPQDVAAVRAAD